MGHTMTKPLTKRQKQFSHAHLANAAREEGRANEMEIYGHLLPMVRYLRAQQWVIFREGNYFRVGTKLTDENGLISFYERIKEREDRRTAVLVEAERPQGKTKAREDGGNLSRRGNGVGGSRQGSGKTVPRGRSGKPQRSKKGRKR